MSACMRFLSLGLKGICRLGEKKETASFVFFSYPNCMCMRDKICEQDLYWRKRFRNLHGYLIATYNCTYKLS